MLQATEDNRTVKATTSSVESMGQLLLQGYCMLADGCADCMVPLMRNPEGTKDICVHCGKSFPVMVEGQRGGTDQGLEKLGQHQAGKTQDASALLAERMIQGCKMLSEHCPICQTPLLATKSEGKYCVLCDLPVRNGGPDATVDSTVAHGSREQDIEDKERNHLDSDGVENQNRESVRVGQLKTKLAVQILEYMSNISLSLYTGGKTKESTVCMDSGQILTRLSECADILSKIDRMSL